MESNESSQCSHFSWTRTWTPLTVNRGMMSQFSGQSHFHFNRPSARNQFMKNLRKSSRFFAKDQRYVMYHITEKPLIGSVKLFCQLIMVSLTTCSDIMAPGSYTASALKKSFEAGQLPASNGNVRAKVIQSLRGLWGMYMTYRYSRHYQLQYLNLVPKCYNTLEYFWCLSVVCFFFVIWVLTKCGSHTKKKTTDIT